MSKNNFLKLILGYFILIFIVLISVPIGKLWFIVSVILLIGGIYIQYIWNTKYDNEKD